MLVLAGVVPTPVAAHALLLRKVESGDALEVFMKMVRMHGGKTDVLEDPRRFPVAAIRQDYSAPCAGVVMDVDAEKIGRASLLLGAGRTKTTDVIDPAAGLSGLMKVGERVELGQPLATLHAASRARVDEAIPLVREAFVVGEGPAPVPPLVLDRL
jgi:thymidine phosphorylase